MTKSAFLQITFDNREFYKIGFESKEQVVSIIESIKEQADDYRKTWIYITDNVEFKRDNFNKTVRSIEIFEGGADEG